MDRLNRLQVRAHYETYGSIRIASQNRVFMDVQ
jgi:hypothetical protein